VCLVPFPSLPPPTDIKLLSWQGNGEPRRPIPPVLARAEYTPGLQSARNVTARGEDPDVEFLKRTSFESASSRRTAWGTVTRGFVHNMVCYSICRILLFGVANISEKGWSSYDTDGKPLYALSSPLLGWWSTRFLVLLSEVQQGCKRHCKKLHNFAQRCLSKASDEDETTYPSKAVMY
jgi:hypothetical protein